MNDSRKNALLATDLAPDQSAQLSDLGIVILEGLMSPAFCGRLRSRIARLHEHEGERAGAEFKQERGCLRLANLVAKGEEFAEVIGCPKVLACVRKVLGPAIKLSSLNARTALPGCPSQPLHADMGAIADAQGYWVCNTVWMLDDFTPHNGAIRYVPGSHRWGHLPQDSLNDRSSPPADEALITGSA
ncbi:MAG TPA: phytanoyl-CoA dioxygenase family protein, partial [Planctomycetaceae bacterium]|nr:phytanoyl-CoA dioxygenase family protein [Planctomycetaceae bacterium]